MKRATAFTGEIIRFETGLCSLGTVLAAWSEAGLCALLLGDDPLALTENLRRRFPRVECRPVQTGEG